MTLELTSATIAKMLPTCKNVAEWLPFLCNELPLVGITTPERLAMFFAQTGHESTDYNQLEENLYYSAEGLLNTFPKYFGVGKNDQLVSAKKPMIIANIVYGGRLGNTKPGDGYLFRGRGLIGLTGRTLYSLFGSVYNMTAEQAAVYICTQEGAVRAATWYWSTRNLNTPSDNKDLQKATRIINGGRNGIDDRQIRFDRAIKLLGGTSISEPTGDTEIQAETGVFRSLKLGSSGADVAKVQMALKLKVIDGKYGAVTMMAVREWQRTHNLVPDGVAGPKTQGALMFS